MKTCEVGRCCGCDNFYLILFFCVENSETKTDKTLSPEIQPDKGWTSEEVGGADVGGASETTEKTPGAAAGDSQVFRVQLSLPGVAHPVDIMVRRLKMYCGTGRVSVW